MHVFASLGRLPMTCPAARCPGGRGAQGWGREGWGGEAQGTGQLSEATRGSWGRPSMVAQGCEWGKGGGSMHLKYRCPAPSPNPSLSCVGLGWAGSGLRERQGAVPARAPLPTPSPRRPRPCRQQPEALLCASTNTACPVKGSGTRTAVGPSALRPEKPPGPRAHALLPPPTQRDGAQVLDKLRRMTRKCP